jgi:hypothetical protein
VVTTYAKIEWETKEVQEAKMDKEKDEDVVEVDQYHPRFLIVVR